MTGRSPWTDIIGPCYARASLARALGWTENEVSEAASSLRVLELLTDDDVLLYPAFQVRDGRLVEGLAQVLQVLNAGTRGRWTWAQWLNTRLDDEVGGELPSSSNDCATTTWMACCLKLVMTRGRGAADTSAVCVLHRHRRPDRRPSDGEESSDDGGRDVLCCEIRGVEHLAELLEAPPHPGAEALVVIEVPTYACIPTRVARPNNLTRRREHNKEYVTQVVVRQRNKLFSRLEHDIKPLPVHQDGVAYHFGPVRGVYTLAMEPSQAFDRDAWNAYARRATRRRVVGTILITIAVVLVLLYAGRVAWLFVMADEGDVPSASVVPLPAGAEILGTTEGCGSGGCTLNVTVRPPVGQSAEGLATEMGTTPQLLVPGNIWDPRTVSVFATPSGGILNISLDYSSDEWVP